VFETWEDESKGAHAPLGMTIKGNRDCREAEPLIADC
jgi:hypothetical protein